MAHDTLSDVLRTVRLSGAVFFYVSGGDEWAAGAPATKDIGARVMPGAEHVMQYHVVVAGSCWAALDGEPPVRLAQGDIVVFPHGDAHALSSAPGKRIDPQSPWILETNHDRLPVRIAYDGAGIAVPTPPGTIDKTTVVCGFLSCDATPFNPILASLPRMLCLPADTSSPWIAHVLAQAVAESSTERAGSSAMLARISEMLFVEAVRRYAEALPLGSTGWLSGLQDRHIGRALALLHAEPARDWSLEALGEAVGLSRSALHERFIRILGQPPMQYLAHWRMQVACGLLRGSRATVASIALDVGYDSEASFTRAFKRIVGSPPATWRRALGQPAPVPREALVPT